MPSTTTMAPEGQVQIAPLVCEPCKRRKKKCDKGLPTCGRCNRLFVKCWYIPVPSSESGSTSGSSNGNSVLPPLVDVIPGFISQPSASFSFNDLNPHWALTNTRTRAGVEEQVSGQVWTLLNAICKKRGDVPRYCKEYFSGFNKNLPVMHESLFFEMLGRGAFGLDSEVEAGDCHFNALLLGILLVTYLSPKPKGSGDGADELYTSLKNIFSVLQSTGNLTLELLQLGVLITSWEYCQAKQSEAWLTIGACVRMAQMLGLHTLVRQTPPYNEVKRRWFENRRCVWWCVVVLERLVNQEYMNSTLPFASAGPTLHDFLPLVPLQDGIDNRVKDEILLPDDVNLASLQPEPREFTRFGPFAATIQMLHVTGLTTKHILDESKSNEHREIDAAKLDVALQNFTGACIPPPGKAVGHYCGPYSLRTCAALSLHLYEYNMATQADDQDGMARATSALMSIARIIVYATKMSFQGVHMDFDGLAFWAHKIAYMAGMMYIQFGEKDAEWKGDIEMLKTYLRYFAPRYKLLDNYLEKFEEAEAAAMVAGRQ